MLRPAWFALLLACSPGLCAKTPPSDPGKAACAVWQRELSFARSVERHDATAFAEHVFKGAVFDANSARPTRGLDAIAKRWAPLIAGKGVRLSWYPRQVVVAGDPDLAYSSGAYLYEDLAPSANPRFVLGEFATVWRRGHDGVWRVSFDGGNEGRPATDAEVQAFHAGRQSRCPASIEAA
ncbi:ketosteroid isomerase [Frateuria sp. Soil773]|uniref:YybH family protein n=1 Tax=Frateuria sp. Soil773 TaxID=1736407 RepID=UPI0006F68E6A|nr:ketosteroid isomerase [Frateuria sp. Soil773]KRE96772.1 ketosteroid isomerase [Frateuria sp. Soil773]